jgi:hypothetical protein
VNAPPSQARVGKRASGDSENVARRNSIRQVRAGRDFLRFPSSHWCLQMMVHAWDGYVKFAWGRNELAPVTQTGVDGSFPEYERVTCVLC